MPESALGVRASGTDRRTDGRTRNEGLLHWLSGPTDRRRRGKEAMDGEGRNRREMTARRSPSLSLSLSFCLSVATGGNEGAVAVGGCDLE